MRSSDLRAELSRLMRGLPSRPEFADQVAEALLARCTLLGRFPPDALFEALIQLALDLYDLEQLDEVPDRLPGIAHETIEEARYRDTLLAQITKLSDPQFVVDCIISAVTEWLGALLVYLPESIFSKEFGEEVPALSTVSIVDMINDVPRVIDTARVPFMWLKDPRAKQKGIFKEISEQLERNQYDLSGVPYLRENRLSPKLISPNDYDGSAAEAIDAYLRYTPFRPVFDVQVPFSLPEQTRFEHHWIIAGSGHGKTQTLQFLIQDDLARVARGEASLVVIDSQGDLINNISSLKVFAEGQVLHDKLCLIDPTDIEFPAALNLFDIGLSRMAGYSELDRERLLNSAIEVLEFILGSLLGAEMTSRQSTLFRYAIQAMLVIPDATIHTFREFMQPHGYQKYLPHLQKLEGTAREFFETQFNNKLFDQTKQQVVARLFTICENRTFERLFANPKTKLNLFDEINSGKVVLINTAKDLLKQTGTEVFGRFFIALLAQAAQERATLPKHRRVPTFVYVDEAQDYVANDTNIAVILEQARKQNIGLVVAHQYLAQLSAKVLDSLHANTSIKFAGGVGDRDAHALARNMRAKPEMLERQSKGSFAAFVRNHTDTAVSLKFPFGVLEGMPRMSATERKKVRDRMREKYATARAQPQPASANPGAARTTTKAPEAPSIPVSETKAPEQAPEPVPAAPIISPPPAEAEDWRS